MSESESTEIQLPPLPSPDGSAGIVVGHQQVGAMTADVVEEVAAWTEALVLEYARAAVLAERERCAKVCIARMEEAERQSGPEAAGHLEFVADVIRKG